MCVSVLLGGTVAGVGIKSESENVEILRMRARKTRYGNVATEIVGFTMKVATFEFAKRRCVKYAATRKNMKKHRVTTISAFRSFLRKERSVSAPESKWLLYPT